ncbi:hypothetical protein [Streptomyces sp. NPDC020917]|uniref:hypothetical protein n=1 Tax=Streptomyces sp. NPDC020917 TaxID=3365102 RepID=UPI00379EF1DD
MAHLAATAVVDGPGFWEVKMVSNGKKTWAKELASRLAIAAAVKALMMVITDVVLRPHD